MSSSRAPRIMREIPTTWAAHLPLPELRRRDRDPLPRGDGAHPRDGELAPHDDADGPGVGLLQVDEGDERGRDEDLVGDRVEEHPERRHLLEPPRDPAVEEVGEGRHEEDAEREVLLRRHPRQQDDDEERDEEDAEERQRVRDVEHRARILGDRSGKRCSSPDLGGPGGGEQRPPASLAGPCPQVRSRRESPSHAFAHRLRHGRLARPDRPRPHLRIRRPRRRRDRPPGPPLPRTPTRVTTALSRSSTTPGSCRGSSRPRARRRLAGEGIPGPPDRPTRPDAVRLVAREVARPARRHRDHGLAQPARVERRQVQVVVRRERHGGDVRGDRRVRRPAPPRRGPAAPSRRSTSSPRTPRRSPRASTSTRSGGPASGSSGTRCTAPSGELLAGILGEGHPTRVTTIRSEVNPSFGGVHPEPIPEHLGASVARLGVRAIRRGARERRRRRPARRPRPRRFVRDAPPRPGPPRREPRPAAGRIRGGIAKTFSTSLLVDRVAARLGVPLHVTPIGFKWIAEKMLSGDVGIGGEESGGLGVSFFLPERDGVLSGLLVLEAVALSGGSFAELLARQESDYGSLRVRPSRRAPADAGPEGVRRRAPRRVPPPRARGPASPSSRRSTA